MKKKFICTLLLTGIVANLALPVFAQGAEVSNYNNSEVLCEEHDEHSVCDENIEAVNSQDSRFVALPAALLKMFVSMTYKNGIHATHSSKNWYNADYKGYSNYIIAFNDGGRHCYNMCNQHNNINPYKYGFKDKYLCHD